MDTQEYITIETTDFKRYYNVDVQPWIHNMSVTELELTRKEIIDNDYDDIDCFNSFKIEVNDTNKEDFKQDFARYLQNKELENIDLRFNSHNNKIKLIEKQLQRAQDIIQQLTSELSNVTNVVNFRKSIQDLLVEENSQLKAQVNEFRTRILRLEQEVL